MRSISWWSYWLPILLGFQACLETSPRSGPGREDAIEIKLALTGLARREVFTFLLVLALPGAGATPPLRGDLLRGSSP